jgi:diguanylate cyclase (GGDEF)-like protein
MLNHLQLKNRKLELKLCAIFLLVSLILGYIGWSSYRELNAYHSAESKVLAINEQLRALNRFMVAMVDSETGQRGYLLTNQEAFLEPYYSGLDRANTAANQINTLLGHEKNLVAVLEEINSLKAEKLAQMARTVALAKAGDVNRARELVSEGSGKRTMDEIRTRVDRLLAEKRQEADNIKHLIGIQSDRSNSSLKLFIAAIIASMVLGYVIIFRDLTARRRLNQALAFAHNYDSLTGLLNRTYFSVVSANYLRQALRDKTMAAILVVDLDNFSSINTRYGYTAGDLLLKDIGGRLKDMGRKNDVIARLDGDEFAMLVSHVDNVNELRLLADRIIQTLNPALISTMRDQYIGASIGIAVYPSDAQESEQLLLKAKIAANNAKAEGKRHYRFFDNQIRLSLTWIEKLTHQLQGALQREELSVLYQPQVDLATKQIFGVEALVRWNSPELGNIRPDEFIPIAERTGLILPIGTFVLREACKQVAQWNRQGCNWRLSVNASPLELLEEDYAAIVKDELAASGLPPELLEIEVTERALLNELAVVELEKIKQLGVKVSIDDFGTGYSSLSYLARFPVNYIKIDKSFIENVPVNQVHCSLITSMIQMASALGIQVIAEGVETAEHAAFLEQEQCHIAQGYFYFKPQSIQELERLIKNRYVVSVPPAT